MEGVEDSPDFWSGPVQSYNSPVEFRIPIQLDWSTYGPLLDCDCKYVSVRTLPPGKLHVYIHYGPLSLILPMTKILWTIMPTRRFT